MTAASPIMAGPGLDAEQLAMRAGGSWHGDRPVTGRISTIEVDSRKSDPGSLFVALPGASADGHDFIAAAAGTGAAAALVAHPDPACNLPQLVVPDVKPALDRLGIAGRTAHRAAGGRLAGITGSVGKTGSKEMLAHLLHRVVAPAENSAGNSAGNGAGCVASRASFNNHLGVPMTLAMLPDAPLPAIQEMGMNAPGEISQLSQMARPDVAVITCIADSHAGFFDSLADIAAAKGEIFDGMASGGTAILNRDDAFFDALAAQARAAGITDIVTFGSHEEADYRLKDITPTASGQKLSASLRGTDLQSVLGMRNAHWAHNAMAVLAAVDALGFDAVRAADELHDFNDLPGRGAQTNGRLGNCQITLIDDSYNAGPRSMHAALVGLHSIAPQILVLSDMLELGEGSAAAHTMLAPPILALRPRIIITIGPDMSRMAADLPCLAALHVAAATPEEAITSLHDLARNGDTIFIKGSLGSGSWRVAKSVLDGFAHTPSRPSSRPTSLSTAGNTGDSNNAA